MWKGSLSILGTQYSKQAPKFCLPVETQDIRIAKVPGEVFQGNVHGFLFACLPLAAELSALFMELMNELKTAQGFTGRVF